MFERFKLKDELLKAIKKLRLTKPTEIQSLSIPMILEGKDVIGESATGSGKTLAFGAGIIEKVIPGKGLQGLVLTPTRELAEQVKESLRSFSPKIKTIAVYGGVSMNPQIQGLTRAEVVVATPGRLLDHLRNNTVNLSKISILVLDEADRMLDMGFIDDVQQIIKQCPRNRQTLFFSATISPDIRELADRYMRNPKKVSAKRYVDPSKLKQVYYDVQKNLKIALLIHLLKKEKSGLVMVFCNSRDNVDFVVRNLKPNGINAIGIHGGYSQNKRTNTIELFNNAKVGVLVCTDVAARGLHIENVSHVYNYDIPRDPKDYVHRIGRTARAGEEGMVVNLLCDFDHDNFSRIFRDYSFNIEKRKRPYLEKVQLKKDFRNDRRQRGRGPSRRGAPNRRNPSHRRRY
ncbi:DEAD/DEAH box helicase [Candidatus Woesearchaeota archaeon]|nr:DEAD/DEAH box helicase [Candidatus Woesearchaeota archaeon]